MQETYVLIENMRPVDWVMFTLVGAAVMALWYEFW